MAAPGCRRLGGFPPVRGRLYAGWARPSDGPRLSPWLLTHVSNKEIAVALDIGGETVKTHIGHLLAKLQVENRAQAIVQALKRGLVTLDELD
jgi:hypothetical protein